MSYSKLYKTCQDHAVGFHGINQFIDNSNAIQAAFGVEHGLDETPQYGRIGGGTGNTGGSGGQGGGTVGLQYRAIGHHNTPLIPRGVLTVRKAPVLGYGYVEWSGNNFYSMANPAEGQYFIGINGLASFWGKASAFFAGGFSDIPFTSCVPYYGATGGTGLYVYAGLLPNSAGAFPAAAQLEFSVTLFGRP